MNLQNLQAASLAASSYLAAQLSIIPIRPDGSKKCSLEEWKSFAGRRATPAHVKAWFTAERIQGVAIIGGQVSGNLEILDFDLPELIEPYTELVNEHAPDLLARLIVVQTPRGGQHLYYRCAQISGNQKLALRKNADGKIGTLIETRGEGGYALAPGCPPECHPLKKTYELVQGSFENIPVVAPEERDLLLACARSFNEVVKESQCVRPEKASTNGLRPGEAFNQRGDLRALLELHGWRPCGRSTAGERWQRPGGQRPSATLFANGNFYVFSTNASPLEFERSYSPFACFAFLEHNGDFKAAAKALAAAGYGTAKEAVPAKAHTILEPMPAEKKPGGESEEATLSWTAEGYAASATGMKYRRVRKGENTSGDDILSLCNFNARITAEVIEDDGVEVKSHYELEAELAGDPVRRKGTIAASEYSGLKWLDDLVGVRGIIFPGKGEHVRCAIKSRSQDAVVKRVVAHTGWRHEGNTSPYYHSGGAIGVNGFITAEVKLPTDFAAYCLPDPPQGQARNTAITASLNLLDLASDELTVPSLSAPAAAILGGTDFSHHLTGQSGTHKSCWAALLLGHFGAEFRFDRLPAHWAQDTAIALLTKAHLAKDAILVIDDFKPLLSKVENQKMIQKAEFVLRAQANRAGRGRAMTDGGLRATKVPRGLVVSTGEDVPPGESLRARLVITEFGQGEIKSDKLTIAQKQARNGVFAQATAAFIQWLATDNLISKLHARRDDGLERWRDHWLAKASSAHKRHASNLAHITYSWRIWLHFIAESGAMSDAKVEGLWEKRILPALEQCGANQAKWLVSESPADRFIELIRAALSSGAAHLAHIDGKRPDSDIALACGWRDDDPKSKRIGFVDADGVYLIPDSAYEVVTGFGEGIGVTQTVLWKRLHEAGKILRDEARGTFKFRKTIGGVAHDSIHLKRDELL